MISAAAMVLTITPTSSSEYGLSRPCIVESLTITASVAIDARKAAPGTTTQAGPATPSASTAIAPTDAPPEMPITSGLASGLRSSACSAAPEAASPPPTAAPSSTRGKRVRNRITKSGLSARDRSSARPMSTCTAPTVVAPTMESASMTASMASTDAGALRGQPSVATHQGWPAAAANASG